MCYLCFKLGKIISWDLLATLTIVSISNNPPPRPPPFVFLHARVLDIDQLNRIMLLVGNPGPELMTKMSSDSVSVTNHPAPFCHSALSFLCLRCISDKLDFTSQAAPIWTFVCFPNGFVLLLCFLSNICYELQKSPNRPMSRAEI